MEEKTAVRGVTSLPSSTLVAQYKYSVVSHCGLPFNGLFGTKEAKRAGNYPSFACSKERYYGYTAKLTTTKALEREIPP